MWTVQKMTESTICVFFFLRRDLEQKSRVFRKPYGKGQLWGYSLVIQHTSSYGKVPYSMEKSTINCHFP